MDILYIVSWIIFLLTASASPEIPSKGKHTRLLDAHKSSLDDLDMPRFAEPIANATVTIGRDALLACVVENLKGYKVAWVRVDTQTILSIHHNVISQNNRISLTYNDHRSWYLHIKEVEESDRGWYMCQINTDPMRSRKGYLQVVVPPIIIESMTSSDMVVREGLNVTLMCKARGYPEPYVMWRREDGAEMLIAGEHVHVADGELLQITKVSRLHMAAYLCVASNNVPPSISKRVHLRVQFPPMLSIPNQLEGAYIGQDVVLECHTEAYPASINYWTTERGDMIISDTSRAGDKYETTSTVNGYTKYMKLKIRSVGPNDFGTYRCVAKNSLGETDGNIKLDEMPTPTTAVITDTTLLNRSLDGKRRRNKFDLNSLPDYGVEEWRDGAGNAIVGDNNQTPVRNPPGAYHNAAGSLAQHNLLGSIIHWIKMQSFGICKRLSSLVIALSMEFRELWQPAYWYCQLIGKGERGDIDEQSQKQKEMHEHEVKETSSNWITTELLVRQNCGDTSACQDDNANEVQAVIEVNNEIDYQTDNIMNRRTIANGNEIGGGDGDGENQMVAEVRTSAITMVTNAIDTPETDINAMSQRVSYCSIHSDARTNTMINIRTNAIETNANANECDITNERRVNSLDNNGKRNDCREQQNDNSINNNNNNNNNNKNNNMKKKKKNNDSKINKQHLSTPSSLPQIISNNAISCINKLSNDTITTIAITISTTTTTDTNAGSRIRNSRTNNMENFLISSRILFPPSMWLTPICIIIFSTILCATTATILNAIVMLLALLIMRGKLLEMMLLPQLLPLLIFRLLLPAYKNTVALIKRIISKTYSTFDKNKNWNFYKNICIKLYQIPIRKILSSSSSFQISNRNAHSTTPTSTSSTTSSSSMSSSSSFGRFSSSSTLSAFDFDCFAVLR